MQRDYVILEDIIDKDLTPQPSDEGPSRDLDQSSWLEFQIAVAKEVVDLLEEAADNLKEGKGKREKRVHNVRIAFRRWYTIWSVLCKEGFETKSFHKKLGRKLKKAYKLLGTVRDWDVTLNQGEKFGVPEEILAKWQLERDCVAQESRAGLKRLKLSKLIEKLHKYVDKRARKLAGRIEHNPRHDDIARVAIETYLLKQEVKTQELANKATTLEDLHALRLAIKAWRYLLVEFYGFTSDELVNAQQVLGQIIDLERLHELIANEDGALAKEYIDSIVEKQNELIAQLESIKESLPYGFRAKS